ncbi:SAM-dependent methyltransferase [Anaerocolumna sp. AGMB13020]|uniref:class I SAM-dependent methyltransferase n=1 Tax=Anaerocolumna sp. AGMB13020 TaxID=3081750 RepID=UPI002955BC9D|nr:SAM-dependent methyltransferase [Anaerocolumna sp. AGMB13020]WOO38929.1 SAM-dependent methyltransferase [Anaerocolumna sp. AGMB13020]
MEEKHLSLIRENLNIDLKDIIISNPVKGSEISKITVRPVRLKGKELYQVCEYRNNQVFHKNIELQELPDLIDLYMGKVLKQLLLRNAKNEITMLVSSKGKETLKIKKLQQSSENKPLLKNISHNREKTYIIPEGTFVPFLYDLGVITNEGKVVRGKYDKFKQINRFLEFIEDILPALKQDRELTVLDFGCGKSYLTFAMYYYLKVVKGYAVKIIGLDLKKEVIEHCNELARKYGYDRLNFLVGDIADYEGVSQVDMVVTLHACDTATDYALAKAVRWGAEVILSVPCCQHELNKQLKNDILNPILKYGLLKERMAALATDGLRAELLEIAGYKTQVLEFIDMEHTPKNILIRGVKRNGKKSDNKIKERFEEYEGLKSFLEVQPALYELLKDYLPLKASKEVKEC